MRVCARPEQLLEIHAHDEGELVRIAWHLGNRHLPVQLLGDRIRIRADHVIGRWSRAWAATSSEIEAPFDPEAGAYAGGHNHHQSSSTMTECVQPAAASPIALAAWLSPAFPTGAFAYSHGLEWAVEAGDIHDGSTLRAWLTDIVLTAPAAPTPSCCATRIAPRAIRQRWNNSPNWPPPSRPAASDAPKRWTRARPSCAPRAPGTAPNLPERRRRIPSRSARSPAAHGIDEDTTALAYLQAFTSQPDLRRGAPGAAGPDHRLARARRAGTGHPRTSPRRHATATLDDLGGCAFRADLAAMRHETQYTRLFRS